MAEKMSVDQLLSQQQDAKPLATVEPVADLPDMVKITPWFRATGCLCSLSLVVPKAVIESVKKIGETHYCCGKRLEVVEVTFKNGAQIAVADVFSQVSERGDIQPEGQQGQSGHHQPSAQQQQPTPCPPPSMMGGCGGYNPTPVGYGQPYPPYYGGDMNQYPGFVSAYRWPPPPRLPNCHVRGNCDQGCLERSFPYCILPCSADPTGASCLACLGISWGTCCSKWIECN